MITKTSFELQVDVSHDDTRPEWVTMDYLSAEEAAISSTWRARLEQTAATYPVRDVRFVRIETHVTVLDEKAWNPAAD